MESGVAPGEAEESWAARAVERQVAPLVWEEAHLDSFSQSQWRRLGGREGIEVARRESMAMSPSVSYFPSLAVRETGDWGASIYAKAGIYLLSSSRSNTFGLHPESADGEISAEFTE